MPTFTVKTPPETVIVPALELAIQACGDPNRGAIPVGCGSFQARTDLPDAREPSRFDDHLKRLTARMTQRRMADLLDVPPSALRGAKCEFAA